jgi:hypothetical protein
LLFKIFRFTNSKLDLSPNRKPFKGLRAAEFHINSMENEYLANSIFDDAIISDLCFESAPNLVGFLDLSNHLPTGKLTHRLEVMRSYKIDALCSHSLPSFVDPETFRLGFTLLLFLLRRLILIFANELFQYFK